MKKSQENFNVLCIIAKYETERYRKVYDDLQKEKDAEIKKINGGYIQNTPLYRKAIEEVEEKFKKDVSELRIEYSKNVGEAIEDVRKEELNRVQTVSESKLAKIKAIADIPMDEEELLAIAEKYDADNDYWCGRVLCNIAELNGIDGYERHTEATFSVKNNILNQIADQVEEMCRDYDGHNQKDVTAKARTLHILLSEDVITRCKELWNGEANVVSDEEFVSKAYLAVHSKHTDIEKGIALANVLKKAKGEKRNLLLCQIAEDKDVSEYACRMSGFGTEIFEFKEWKAVEYRKAQKVVEQMAMTEDKTIRKQIMAQHSDNEFLNGVIKSEAKKNIIFKEFVGEENGSVDYSLSES